MSSPTDEPSDPAGHGSASLSGSSMEISPGPAPEDQQNSFGETQHSQEEPLPDLDPVSEDVYFMDTEEEEEDDEDRPNRFHGPSSTWRKYTASERSLAASLDQQRANDLSVHLYNAHALKARLRDPALTALAKPWHSKRCWLARDADGKVDWHPDARWTAWPLPAEEVPRREEVFGVDAGGGGEDGTYRKVEGWRPSGDLEEELQALVLRKAKERFRRRRWAGDEVGGKDGERETGRQGKAKLEANDQDAEDEEDVSVERSPSSPKRPSTTAASPKIFDEPAIKTAFLADDEEAHKLLRPSLRHILTKLDDLLLGLHKSRAGHQRTASTPRSRSQSTKPPTSRSRSRSRTVTKATGSTCAKSRRTSDTDEDSTEGGEEGNESDDEDHVSPSRPALKRRASGQSRHELGQRDWSEVLGMASLTGWDPDVVDRAARRCAALFGEGMVLRRMPETAADHLQDEVVEYRPEMIALSDTDLSDEGIAIEGPEEVVVVYWCPYEDCLRHDQAYEKRWRWREHLQRSHGLAKAQIAEVEERLGFKDKDTDSTQSDDEASLEEEAASSDRKMVLPEQGDEDAMDAELEVADVAEESGPEMVGGVHVDGFMRPISIEFGRGKDRKERRRKDSTSGTAAKRVRLDDDPE